MKKPLGLIWSIVMGIASSALISGAAHALVDNCPTANLYPSANVNVVINGIAIDDACRHFYASVPVSGRVYVYPTTTIPLAASPLAPTSPPPSIVVGPNPYGLDTTSDGNTLYVANNGENTLSAINLLDSGTWSSPPKIPLPNGQAKPQYVAVTSTGDVLIATDAGSAGIQLFQYTPRTQSFRNRTADIPAGISSAVLKHNLARSEISGIQSGTQFYKYVVATDRFVVGSPMLTVASDGTLTAFDPTGRLKFTTTAHSGVSNQVLAVTNFKTGAVVARIPLAAGVAVTGANAVSMSADGSLMIFLTAQGFSIVSLVPTSDTRFMAFSSASGRSYLRIHNTGVNSGSVKLTLADSSTGEVLGAWVRSSDPSSETQFEFSAIEAGAQIVNKPDRYAVTLQAPAGFFGYMQYLAWQPSPGILANLSTCYGDTPGRVGTDPYQISGVHSSLLSANYTSSIIVTSGDDPANPPQSVVLTVYDSGDNQLGQYTTPPIPGKGQFTISGDALEAAIHFTPPNVAFYYHYVVVASPFKGFLQHRVYNGIRGVFTDLTPACLINSPLQTIDALGPPGPAFDTVTVAGVFSTTQTDFQSSLRLTNENASSAVSATVMLSFTDASGAQSRTWVSPSVPARGELVVPISTIENGSGAPFTKPAFYTATVTMPLGKVQHFIWRPTAGTMTNASTCDANASPRFAGDDRVGGVHSSLLAANYPSYLAVHSNMSVSTGAGLDIYDANTGNALGHFTTPAIAPGGDIVLSMAQIETAMNLIPSANMSYYEVVAGLSSITSNAPAPPFHLQHLVLNIQSGLLEDMTKGCRAFQRP